MSVQFFPDYVTVNLNNPYGEVAVQANEGETIEQLLARVDSEYGDRDISSVVIVAMKGSFVRATEAEIAQQRAEWLASSAQARAEKVEAAKAAAEDDGDDDDGDIEVISSKVTSVGQSALDRHGRLGDAGNVVSVKIWHEMDDRLWPKDAAELDAHHLRDELLIGAEVIEKAGLLDLAPTLRAAANLLKPASDAAFSAKLGAAQDRAAARRAAETAAEQPEPAL